MRNKRLWERPLTTLNESRMNRMYCVLQSIIFLPNHYKKSNMVSPTHLALPCLAEYLGTVGIYLQLVSDDTIPYSTLRIRLRL